MQGVPSPAQRVLSRAPLAAALGHWSMMWRYLVPLVHVNAGEFLSVLKWPRRVQYRCHIVGNSSWPNLHRTGEHNQPYPGQSEPSHSG